ncbi:hypothetical protein [Winogradskyella sp.]|uniref:hypothetical protein n=1 Tax=Winogradskyella sp. TaxID=1883156 RepID=UPI0026230A84|nr:hypothetical protein [Winogradskyella sp.]
MKKILFILILTILVGCEKDDGNDLIGNNGSLNHAELGFELDEPDVILNELSKGNLDSTINSIFLVMYGNTYRKWEFEYLENTNTVDKMTFYLPHYQGCEKNIYQFNYNSSQNIETVVSTRTNTCNEFEVIKSYSFNYNQNGLLKSIFMDNEFTVQEYYIGYYPNGKVKEIWWDSRGSGDNVDFSVQRYYYDVEYNNVVRMEKEISGNTHIYKYEYDNRQNPFKGFFIAYGIFIPYVGHSYLSLNNVSSITENRFSNTNDNEFTYPYDFEYSPSNDLIRYRDIEDERVYHINQ